MMQLDQTIGFRVTRKERRAIEHAATRNGMKLSEWVRVIVMHATEKGVHVERTFDVREAAA